MASVIALIFLVVAAYVVVVGGGIAFEITGMNREMARFQALSAFTGTGFTTMASEQIVEHRVRRRIAMTLIVLGWAGVASVIATLMRSFQATSVLQSVENIALGLVMSAALVWVLRRYSDQLVLRIRRVLAKRLGDQLVLQDVLFRVHSGLGVTRIEVPEGCPLADIPLRDLHLRAHNLTILLIEHGEIGELAGPDAQFSVGDQILAFGRVDHVEQVFAPRPGPVAEASHHQAP